MKARTQKNIIVSDGNVTLTINNDPNRVISFDPTDLGFAERYYDLLSDFEEKEKEYRLRIEKLEKDTSLDSYGLPRNTRDSLKLTRDVCDYLKMQINNVFGEGTCETVFGKMTRIEMFEEFFGAVAIYIQSARTAAADEYLSESTEVMQ